ncbi:hypothetical protein ABS234_19865, partial [Acinetobacter baumannii]|uniref:hypothetical protein n=1 Tax=Acinetobacter baumannii TaxID=470 RepID=UPI00332AFAD9
LYESEPEAALPKVLDVVAGTWTYTEVPADFWYRFQISPDGKVLSQVAMPSMDGWGEADEARLVPFTSKYLDTGERYYGLKAQGQGWALIIERD